METTYIQVFNLENPYLCFTYKSIYIETCISESQQSQGKTSWLFC